MVANLLGVRVTSVPIPSMFGSDESGRPGVVLSLFGGGNNTSGEFWSAAAVTAIAGVALGLTIFCNSRRVHLKSPWCRRRRKHALAPQQWKSLFTSEGKLRDGGIKFLKKVRSGGVHPSIRKEAWPFLLGVYDLNTTAKERETIKAKKRMSYAKLRKRCELLSNKCSETPKIGESRPHNDDSSEDLDSGASEVDKNSSEFFSTEETSVNSASSGHHTQSIANSFESPSGSAADTDSSGSDLSEEPDKSFSIPDSDGGTVHGSLSRNASAPPLSVTKVRGIEDFSTWQRIIRVDAVRANSEWVPYSPSQVDISEETAGACAEAAGLKDYDHLEPNRMVHATRLVAILEAYAIYDPKIGYCQGMSDLLSPIIAMLTDDYEAFWCFVGFMRKARHNFRLDEVGIRRQLNIVSKIIKCKDGHLFRHLEKLQAEDCFFVYRMVVVLFRRELSFEQTLCLWEVMWADQAAIRAGIGKSAFSVIRQRAPPTDDLLLYAIAACVLQRRKLIIEKYNSMDEIIRECNNMAGQLDVWKLLDDAHDLIVNVHDKISSSF